MIGRERSKTASIAFVAMEEYEIRRGLRTLIATTRSRARAPAEAQAEAEATAEVETQLAPVSTELPQHAAKVRTKACVRSKETSEVVVRGLV